MLARRIAAVPLVDRESRPRSWRSAAMTVISAALATWILWSTYTAGVSRGMNRVLANGPEIDTTLISVALSESVYGLDLGYVGLMSVYVSMMTTLKTGVTNPNDDAMLRNLRDGELINKAIADASSLQSTGFGNISDHRIMVPMYYDLGAIDYVKLSFRLFGRRIEALYNTFFAIVGLSALLYLLTFPNSIASQLVLLATLFAFQIELQLPIFSASMPSFVGVRHGSTLCLVPMWYFAILTVQRRPLSWLSLAMAVGQLSLLIIAFTVRATAIWAVVFLVLLAVTTGTYRWLLTPRTERTGLRWLRSIALWPVVALIGALVTHDQYLKLKLHPVYFSDDVIPHHVVWHSAYVGFQYVPEVYGFPVPKSLLGSDSIAFEGAMRYMSSTHFIGNETGLPSYRALEAGGYFSQWNGGNPKYRLHDAIMRRVVLDTIAKYPRTMVYLYAVKKPIAIWEVGIDQIRRSDPALKWMMLAGSCVAGLLLSILGDRRELTLCARLVAWGLGAVMVALLPCIWAFPVAWSVLDGLLILLGLTCVGGGIVVAAAATLVIEWLRAGQSTPLHARL